MGLRLFLTRTLAGVIGGAVGLLAGLLATLAVAGLDYPDWGPVLMAGGAGLVGGAGLAIGAGCTGRCLILTMVGLGGVGSVLGIIFGVAVDSTELTLVAVTAMLLIAALLIPTWLGKIDAVPGRK